MARTPTLHSSTQPDVRVLAVLSLLQKFILILVVLVAGTTLLAWLVPAMDHLLPASWALMKANTALGGLLCAISLTLSQPRRSPAAVHLSRLLAALVGAIGMATLLEYFTGISLGLDRLLAADTLSSHPGRMSPQTAVCYLLLGVLLFFIAARKGWFSRFIDGIMFLLSLLVSVFTCGYLFGAMRLFGPTMQIRLSPQTLVVLLGLVFTIFNRRAEHGAFSILLGSGIGGKIVRSAAPAALALPFLLAVTRASIVKFGLLQPEYATAIATSITSMLAFVLILVLGWQIDGLEYEVRDLSLRDGLTGLYNRRGFFVLAEQTQRLCRRAGEPYSLLFLDLDNLKLTNDVLGHEFGSSLIEEMAALLTANFRETDVIARFGGDEFVVAGKASAADIAFVSGRLQQSAARANAQRDRPFPLSFSLGYVTSDAANPQTLDQMLEAADRIMYQDKRERKAGRVPVHSFAEASVLGEPGLHG